MIFKPLCRRESFDVRSGAASIPRDLSVAAGTVEGWSMTARVTPYLKFPRSAWGALHGQRTEKFGTAWLLNETAGSAGTAGSAS